MPSDSAEDEAVEVMARALFQTAQKTVRNVFLADTYDDLAPQMKEHYRGMARAAYAAYLSHVQSKMERIGVDPDGEVTEETKVRN